MVAQGGPRRLWTLAENAHTFWLDHQRPDWSRFGFTATASRQSVYFDDPNTNRWDLHRPAPR